MLTITFLLEIYLYPYHFFVFINSGDCGVYMLKHIELHSMSLPLIENMNDENVEYHRRRYTIEIFDGSMEP